MSCKCEWWDKVDRVCLAPNDLRDKCERIICRDDIDWEVPMSDRPEQVKSCGTCGRKDPGMICWDCYLYHHKDKRDIGMGIAYKDLWQPKPSPEQDKPIADSYEKAKEELIVQIGGSGSYGRTLNEMLDQFEALAIAEGGRRKLVEAAERVKELPTCPDSSSDIANELVYQEEVLTILKQLEVKNAKED